MYWHLYWEILRSIISGGLDRGDVSEIRYGTCLTWSGRSSWAIWYLSFRKSTQKWDSAGLKTIFGLRTGGGLEKNGFTQILFILKTFKISFMSWNTDFGSVSPFPMLKLHIKFLSLGKRLFWRVQDFFFWLPYNPPPRVKNVNFVLLRAENHKRNMKIWRLYPLQFLQWYKLP